MSAKTHGSNGRAIVFLIATLSALLLFAPTNSEAAVGDIVGQSCISKAGTNGCALLPQPDSLQMSATVAVAPDGADVYVGAARGITHFRRAPDGSLTYASCVDTSSAVGDGCPTSAPADGGGALTLNAILIAISPNGKTVYATSWNDALTWWTRDLATGTLTWGGCRDGATDAATNGRCGTATTFGGGNFPAGSLAFSQGLAVTPDGTSLFIADQQEGLVQAQLNPTTGVPTPQACFNTTGSAAAGCTSLASGIPTAGSGIAIGSNSRDIYLSSISPGGVTHFQRTPSGVTSFFSCIGSSPTAQCLTAAPNPSFFNIGAIGIGGNNVFTHGGNYGVPEGTVTRMARSDTGALSYVNCSTTVAASGPCAVMPAGTLSGNIGHLPVSPDGGAIYTPQGGNPGALMRLTGDLAFGSCIGLGVAACPTPPLEVAFAAARGGAALSPDGGQLYQAAADQINIFQIQTAPSPPASAPQEEVVKPTAKKPQIRSVKKVRKGKRRGQYKVRIRVRQAGSIKIQLRGRLKKGAKVRALSKSVKRSARRSGTYTLYVRPSRTAVRRKVKSSLQATLSANGYKPSTPVRKTVRLR